MRIYEKNGRKYLSVTSLVTLRYPFDNSGFTTWAWSNGYDPEWINKESTRLGERYHAYLENKFHGISDWADILETEKDKKYHEATEKFFDDGWEILDSEVEVFNDDWNYAGRFDFIGRNKKLGIDKALMDCKTYGAWKGGKYKRDNKKLGKLSMQLTLYSEAIGHKGKMIGVMLDGTGNYTLEDIPKDESVWDWLGENRNEIVKLLQENDVSRE